MTPDSIQGLRVPPELVRHAMAGASRLSIPRDVALDVLRGEERATGIGRLRVLAALPDRRDGEPFGGQPDLGAAA